jgi:hypothetical protein
MPALARVRRQAKAVLCQSNLKQLAICYSMYADDFEGRFMQGWIEGGPTEPEDYWVEALRRYYAGSNKRIGNPDNLPPDGSDLRLCPMADIYGTRLGKGPYGPGGVFFSWGLFTGGFPSTEWDCVNGGVYGSYGFNEWMCDPPPSVTVIQTHETKNNWRTSETKGAGFIGIHGDQQWIDAWPDGKEPPLYEGIPWGTGGPENSMRRICINRHNRYVNWAFMDYSVRKLGLKQLWRIKWHRRYDLQVVVDWTIGTGWLRSYKDYD